MFMNIWTMRKVNKDHAIIDLKSYLLQMQCYLLPREEVCITDQSQITCDLAGNQVNQPLSQPIAVVQLICANYNFLILLQYLVAR